MPRQFVAYEQAHVNNAFHRTSDGALVVATPFDIDEPTKPAAAFADFGSHVAE